MYFFEVPARKRVAQVVCAVLWCVISAGPIFGFAAFKPVLIAQGVYEELCPLDEISLMDASAPKCAEQDLRLNLMFTVAAALTNICALVIGTVLDRWGPRVCGYISAVFLFLSCFFFTNAGWIKAYVDPYIIGYALLALGGPFNYISSFQLSNAFPEKSGLILAIITGAFDTSSAVFLIYKKVWGSHPGFTIAHFFQGYYIVPVFIAVIQATLMPYETYLTPPPDLIPNPTAEQSRIAVAAEAETARHAENAILAAEPSPDENTTLIAQTRSAAKRRSSLGDAYKSAYIEEEIEVSDKPDNVYSIFGILHGFPAGYQFRTPWFGLLAFYSTVQMLRLNYFVATVNSQYTWLFHSIPEADKLNRIFDVALPLAGIVSVPIVGAFLDHYCTAVVLIVLFTMSLIIGVLGIVQNSFAAGLFNVLLFVGFRPFFYTTISDFCAKVFGFETFGQVYGAVMTIAGIFNTLQSVLDKLTHTKYQMNPVPVNIFLILLTIISGGGLVAYVAAQTKLYAEKKKKAATQQSDSAAA